MKGKPPAAYLDAEHLRVCIRGSEDMGAANGIGYRLLGDNEVFPFYELRSAALDLRPVMCAQERLGTKCDLKLYDTQDKQNAENKKRINKMY